MTIKEGQRFQIAVKVKPDAAPGPREATLKLTTTDPQFTEMVSRNYGSGLWQEEAKTCVECGASSPSRPGRPLQVPRRAHLFIVGDRVAAGFDEMPAGVAICLGRGVRNGGAATERHPEPPTISANQ